MTDPSSRPLPERPNDWPYDWYAAESLDPAVIEKQGRFFLHRALNIHRTVAFVGAGVSMAYGRVSWGELAVVQVDGILDYLRPDRLARLSSRVAVLAEQLRGLRDKVQEEKGDAITLAMQIAEQIWGLLEGEDLEKLRERFHLAKDFPKDRTDDNSSVRIRLGKRLFQQSIKDETYDELAHVRRILTNPFSPSDPNGGNDAVDIFAKTLKHMSFARSQKKLPKGGLQRLFSDEIVDALDRAIHDAKRILRDKRPPIPRYSHGSSYRVRALSLATELITTVKGRLGPAPSILPTYNYHVVGLILDLVRFALLDLALKGRNDVYSGLRNRFMRVLRRGGGHGPRPHNRTARENDPLWLLLDKLDIRRFITTNYDLEIEHLLDDIGFDKTRYETQIDITPDDVERVGPLGGQVREIVIEESNAVDLIDFAAADNPMSIQVAHVHGRATDKHHLVVTDRDYQDKYIGPEKHKIIAREGFQVLFGGNPILFAGISLAEGDIMRPLREFAAEHLRRNYSVIALRGATGSKEDRNSFVLEHYIRHGLFVLHYGFLTAEFPGVAAAVPDNSRWLEAFFAYSASVLDAIKILQEGKREATAQNAIEKLTETAAAFGLIFELNGAKPRDFWSDYGRCNIDFELALLNRVKDFVSAQLAAKRDNWRLPEHSRPLFSVVLRKAVKRAENAVYTAALAACLRGIEKTWGSWWSEWAAAPEPRLADLRFSTAMDLPRDAKALPTPDALRCTRWFRYLTTEPLSVRSADRTRLRALFQCGPAPDAARRIFLVTAPRGAGKGAVFAELIRCGDFLLHDGPGGPDLTSGTPAKYYAGHFSASFSFSSEIASVWDALSAFFLDPTKEIFKTVERTDGVTVWGRSSGRIGRFQNILASLSQKKIKTVVTARVPAGLPIEYRYLVVLHAFDLLFDGDGYPKSSEIRAMCDLMFGPAGHAVPVDYVLIAKDGNVPLYFRGPGATARSPDRIRKCPGRPLRLLIDEDAVARDGGERDRIAAIIRRAEIQISRSNSSVNKLLSSANKCERDAGYDYVFIPPQIRPNELSTGRDSSSLLENRFRFTLREIIRHDIKERPSDERLRDECETGYFAARGDEGREARIPADRFFEKVTDYWASRPFTPSIDEQKIRTALGVRGVRSVCAKYATDYKLQELLLRHLAVISIPVEAEVLQACPAVRARLVELNISDGNRLLVIRYGLALLSARGLAFTIQGKRPIFEEGADPASARQQAQPERYQVHRAIQLHIYRKLGAQNVEPADSYFFSVSTYASQTRELPILDANAYSFLHELVNGLIDYPRPDGALTLRPSNVTARCLRAAMGISRTLFSIGVVARFADLRRVSVPAPPRPGYFEQHRLGLRWMLREARRLDDEKKKTPVTGGDAETEHRSEAAWNPFYQDDVVWLFNECGVFSLAQGQCHDAVAMFDAALSHAAKIEGRSGGPIRRRILLNLGATAINRARPNEARRLFEEVHNESSEDETVRMIAQGYLALLDHIGGGREGPLRSYDKVIETLQDLGRSRPVSMFLRHRGDLHRYLRNDVEADRDFAAAIDYAKRAGYEDMANFAIVARARMQIATDAKSEDVKKIARTLEYADHYADAMELPFLKAEASFVHAQLLLKQGETALAADKVTRALRIATLNGLVLRSIAYRSLLADIHMERGWIEEANRMKAQVLQAARSAGYRLVIQGHREAGRPDSY